MDPSPYYPLPSQPPRRSAVPRVLGILALVLACGGAVGSLIWTFGPLSDLQRHRGEEALGFIETWLYLWLAISMVIFVLEMVGATFALMYRALGLRLLTAYAVTALMLIVLDLVVLLGFAPSGFWVKTSVVWPRVVYAFLALPWPVVVVILANLPRSKRACQGGPKQ